MPRPITKADLKVERSFYYDLVGVPYSQGGRTIRNGLDCLGAAMIVLERLHGPDVADELDAYTPMAHTADFAALAAWRMAAKDKWEVVTSGYLSLSKSLPGDIVVQVTSADMLSAHVSIVVHGGPTYPTVVLTADKRRGIICLPGSRLRDVLAVYRYRK